VPASSRNNRGRRAELRTRHGHGSVSLGNFGLAPADKRPACVGGKPRPARNPVRLRGPSRPGDPFAELLRKRDRAASPTAPGDAISRSASSTRSGRNGATLVSMRSSRTVSPIFLVRTRQSEAQRGVLEQASSANAREPLGSRLRRPLAARAAGPPLLAQGRRASIPMASPNPRPGPAASPLRRLRGTPLSKSSHVRSEVDETHGTRKAKSSDCWPAGGPRRGDKPS